MGSRRTHEEAAVAAARAAYLAGFAATSNLEAGRRYGIPTAGTARARLHAAARRRARPRSAAQVGGARHGHHAAGRHLRHRAGHPRRRSRSPARSSGAIRIDSGDLAVLARAGPRAARRARARPAPGSSSPATSTSTRSPRCAAEPGRRLRRGHLAGHRLGRADRRAGLQAGRGRRPAGGQAQRESKDVASAARKSAVRRHKPTGTATEEVVHRRAAPPEPAPHDRPLPVPLVRGGEPVDDLPTPGRVARAPARRRWSSVPWEGLKLSRGEPAHPDDRPPPDGGHA